MKHKCDYCDEMSNENRDALVEAGWSFADMTNIKTDRLYEEVQRNVPFNWC